MPVNSTHPSYDASVESWQRIRDVLAGDAAIKRGGEKYVARLDSQTDLEYQAYVQRSFFYNATARTVAGYLGLIFRKDPILELPKKSATLHMVFKEIVSDVDLVGTTLDSYSKNVVQDVIAMGRAGTLVDWRSEPDNRAYLTLYPAEAILNWREARINGSLKLSLVVLAEIADGIEKEDDPFVVEQVQQIRVLRLVRSTEGNRGNGDGTNRTDGTNGKWEYQVEIWQLLPKDGAKEKVWKLVQLITPLRLGKALTSIPFIFHGPSHSRPEVEKSPIEDMVAANLDHYRLNTDHKHGMHFTALPTAFVTGFDKTAQLRIGSTTAWVTETIGATAGYLEFQGDGLMSFERALDRCERLLAVLGSRLLESQKRVSESAEALAIRQAGEGSIIASISSSVTASLNDVIKWIYWWHSTEAMPEDVTEEQVNYKLNTDFQASLLSATDIQALVAAWQAGAISRDTLLHNFRTGEILPPARTNEQELDLIKSEPPPPMPAILQMPKPTEAAVP